MKAKSEFLTVLDALIVQIWRAPKAQRYYSEHRIWHECANSYQHFMNPRAEVAVGNLSRRSRTLLVQSGCPKGFWPEALQYAADLENRLLQYKYGASVTPYEMFHGVKPDNSVL
eukprot:2651713-Rhodomonas_salina.1